MSERAAGTTRRAAPLYLAVRWPESHVTFHLVYDDGVNYDALRDRILASVREALDECGVHVIETGEEPIRV